MWNIKAEQQGLLPAFDVFRNTSKGLSGRALTGPDDYEQIPELAERSRARARTFMDRMNRQLEKHEFLTGAEFSIADITALVFIDLANRLKMEIPTNADHLKRWYVSVSSRNSSTA